MKINFTKKRITHKHIVQKVLNVTSKFDLHVQFHFYSFYLPSSCDTVTDPATIILHFFAYYNYLLHIHSKSFLPL